MRITWIAAIALLAIGCGGTEAPPPTTPPPAEPPAATAPATPPPSEPAAGTAAAAPGDPVAGKVVYDRICVACHQADGGGMNEMLAASFVKDKTRLAKSDQELLHSIAKGFQGKIGVMPAQEALLSEQERRDALAYIRATFGGK